MTLIIADLTGAKFGSEREVLAKLAEAIPGSAESMHIVCSANQQRYLTEHSPQHLRVVPAMAHFNEIANFIQREFLDGLAKHTSSVFETVILVSFHPTVLRLRLYLSAPVQSRVQCIHWGHLLKSVRSNTFGAQALTRLLSEEDLLQCVEKALLNAGATGPQSGIRMSDIRFHLEREEPRLKKTNPTANVPGIISAVIDFAARKGLVVVDRDVHPVNPPVWLKNNSEAKGLVNLGSQNHTSSLKTEPKAQSEIIASRAASDLGDSNTSTGVPTRLWTASFRQERNSRST